MYDKLNELSVFQITDAHTTCKQQHAKFSRRLAQSSLLGRLNHKKLKPAMIWRCRIMHIH